VIEIKDLQKVIDGKTVIDIPRLDVEGGEIAALVGPVDSGMDILFDLLTGRMRAAMGTIRLEGIDPYTDRERFSRAAGVLFFEDNLYKRQSVLANLIFHCRLRRIPRERATQVLEVVGLADQANAQVEGLSPGLTRRLAFGRAILHQPKILLLAEPFAKCDEGCIKLLTRLIQDQARGNASILILAEDEGDLAPFCDTIFHLQKGCIVDVRHPKEEPVQGPALPFMIPARLEGRVALVDPVDILFIYAQDDRAYLAVNEERLPTQFTMTELEKRLSRSGFFRAHRGYLVNLQHVKEIIPYTRDSFSLRLKDETNTEIPLSKSAARELRELLGY